MYSGAEPSLDFWASVLSACAHGTRKSMASWALGGVGSVAATLPAWDLSCSCFSPHSDPR